MIKEGTKVKINYGEIVKGNSKRTEWVQQHLDDVFTAQVYTMHGSGEVYSLKEDTTDPPWLFFEDDLTVL